MSGILVTVTSSEMGAALAAALDAVIDERVPNERGALLAFLDAWRAGRAADCAENV